MRRIRKNKKKNASVSQNSETPFFSKVQKKLSVGKAGDKYEVEADHMADKVVSKQTENTAIQKMDNDDEIQEKPLFKEVTSLQKQELKEEEPVQKVEEEESVQKTEEEAKEESIQKMEEEETVQEQEEEETVQQKTNGVTTKNPIESQLKSSKGKGHVMDSKTKMEMEQGFGADFSAVKIHTDTEAKNLSNDLGAQAFTTGNDIYFNEGKYDPSSKEGKHLLAHELTHTLQQNSSNSKNVQRYIDDRRNPINNPINLHPSSSCIGPIEITKEVQKLKKTALEAINLGNLSDGEKIMKIEIVNNVLGDEGMFSINSTKFYACERIDLPHLKDATGSGFSAYSDAFINEIGGLMSFKDNVEAVNNNKDLNALLEVLKLIGHEKRHLTISGVPEIDQKDIQPGANITNPEGVAHYLTEEIITTAEEIYINYQYDLGNYTVPDQQAIDIHNYWSKISSTVTSSKKEELKEYIRDQLQERYNSKFTHFNIKDNILHAMENGNWIQQNP